jgi:hypothetical protein
MAVDATWTAKGNQTRVGELDKTRAVQRKVSSIGQNAIISMLQHLIWRPDGDGGSGGEGEGSCLELDLPRYLIYR